MSYDAANVWIRCTLLLDADASLYEGLPQLVPHTQ